MRIRYFFTLLACAGLGAMQEPPVVQRDEFFWDVAIPAGPNDDAWHVLFDQLETTKAFIPHEHVMTVVGTFDTHYGFNNPMMYRGLREFRKQNVLKAVRKAAQSKKAFQDVAGAWDPVLLLAEMEAYCPVRQLSFLDAISYADAANQCELYSVNGSLGGLDSARGPEVTVAKATKKVLQLTAWALGWVRWATERFVSE